MRGEERGLSPKIAQGLCPRLSLFASSLFCAEQACGMQQGAGPIVLPAPLKFFMMEKARSEPGVSAKK